jgi:hypothetical protein
LRRVFVFEGRKNQNASLTLVLAVNSPSDCLYIKSLNRGGKGMSDVTEKMARLGQLRKAALVAIVIPAALLVGCAPQPAPPPPPQPVYTPAPAPPPAPPAVPYVRG